MSVFLSKSFLSKKNYISFIQLATLTMAIISTSVILAKDHQSLSRNTVKNTASFQKKASEIDYKKIIDRGTLRIITPPESANIAYLPRSDSPMDKQIASIKNFAYSLGLKPEIIPLLSFKKMTESLIKGDGDIIVANLTVTEERKEKLAFSVPIDHTHEVVLVPKSDEQTSITKDLAGKKLLLNDLSSFWNRGLDFKKRYPSINLIKQDQNLSDEEVIDLVAAEQYDATIRDSNIAEMYLQYRDDLRIAFKASGKQAIAMGLRPKSIALKSSLDQFLTQKELETDHIKTSFGDLKAIKKRGVLRVLLRNNASSYFLWRGQLMGFEYEMAKAFAKHLKVRLAIFVPKDGEDALEWLTSGKVDIAAGFLQETPEWPIKKVSASRAYHEAFAHIIIHKNEQSIHSVTDLDGKTVVLHKQSIYWDEIEKLKVQGIDINLMEAPENLEIEEIIQKIASKEYAITLADGHFLDIELANNTKVKSAFTLGDQKNHSLAIRTENDKLLLALNGYIKSKKDGKLYSRLYAKYFSNQKQIQRHLKHHQKILNGKKILSQYDELVQKYSGKYGFDWRFITAQMFQESRFDPNARSRAGAIGLMQIMPATGRQLGFSKIKIPNINIHAGTKYMKWLYDKFEIDLAPVDRIWFTLASYNAGLGHVLDARKLATKKGLNKNQWFGNVEKAMLLLSKKEYAKKARYGYVRGREPVGYVKSIQRIYATYLNIIPDKNHAIPAEISLFGEFKNDSLLSATKQLTPELSIMTFENTPPS